MISFINNFFSENNLGDQGAESLSYGFSHLNYLHAFKLEL
jgi:hypothetical protein